MVRARMTSQYAPVVISSCDTPASQREAVSQLLEIVNKAEQLAAIELDGADCAVDEILSVVTRKSAL
jgi:molybdopterin-guanine dinucleotide biosynthesis protein A